MSRGGNKQKRNVTEYTHTDFTAMLIKYYYYHYYYHYYYYYYCCCYYYYYHDTRLD